MKKVILTFLILKIKLLITYFSILLIDFESIPKIVKLYQNGEGKM